MGTKINKVSYFITEVGIVAWTCLLFGMLILLFGTWNIPEQRLGILMGVVSILYGWGRIRQVVDKYEILKEIRKCQ